MKSKFKVANLRLLLGTVCLWLCQGLWAQSTNAPAPTVGSDTQIRMTTGASTGCGYFPGQAHIAAPIPHTQGFGQLESKTGQPAFLLVSEHESDGRLDRDAIVGLWKIKFVAQNSPGIPDGTLIDQGYATWHSDGTEIMNSGRPPITGNFCMGVWKQTRRGVYKLNHFGLSWDPTGTTLIGPANIREHVVVGPSENTYAGTFTIDQFDADGNVLAHVTGLVTAQRITTD